MFTGTRMKLRMILAIGLLAAGTHAFGSAGIALAAGADGTASAVVAAPELIEVMRGLGSAPDAFISPQAPGVPFHEIAIELSEPVVLDDSSTATTAGPAMAPLVLGLRDDGAGMHTVMLSDPVPPGHWVLVTLDVTSPVTGATGRIQFGVAHLPGDIDQTGVVDVRDATEFGREFRNRRAPALVDLNGDGGVDVRDATEFGRLWNGDGGLAQAWAGAALLSPDVAISGAAEDGTDVFEGPADQPELSMVNAIVVPRDFFDAVEALPPGLPIDILRGFDGYDAFVASMRDDQANAGAIDSNVSPQIAAAEGDLFGESLNFSSLEPIGSDHPFVNPFDPTLVNGTPTNPDSDILVLLPGVDNPFGGPVVIGDGTGTSAGDDGVIIYPYPDGEITFPLPDGDDPFGGPIVPGDDVGTGTDFGDGGGQDGGNDRGGANTGTDTNPGHNGDPNDPVNPNEGNPDEEEEIEEEVCVCRWIVTTDADPSTPQITQNERRWGTFGGISSNGGNYSDRSPGSGNDGWYKENGVGPYHVLRARRNWTNCLSPDTAISKTATGEYTANLNVICVNAAGQKCEVPCVSKVHALGFYESMVRVNTNAGAWCPFQANDIEAIAQDEAEFTVNNMIVFNKGVVVQNGNDVTTTISFQFGANAGVSAKDSASGQVSVSFGYSQTSTHDTGSEEDELKARGTKTVPVPAHLYLHAKGREQLNAINRTWGSTSSKSKVWGVVFVGESTCAGTTWGGQIYGLTDRVDAKTRSASNFVESLTGTRPSWE